MSGLDIASNIVEDLIIFSISISENFYQARAWGLQIGGGEISG